MTLQVLDLDFESICEERYDVSLFASGYEQRSSYIPGLINVGAIAAPLILGFTEENHSGTRDQNDMLFLRRWGKDPIPLSTDDEKPIYQLLHEQSSEGEGVFRILLDYSSMSRLWYAAVLNWARFGASGREVMIDFVYSIGSHEKKSPMVIRSMSSIPGCEGRAYRLRESVAIFGLGRHGLAALCVLDRLEADIVYTFLASQGCSGDYVALTQESNKDLINDHKTKAVLQLPLSSVEICYVTLAETISPHRPDGEITLVPMGPKPHVLASILAAMRFPEVACLRVTGTSQPQDVLPTGEIVATRVIVRNKD